MDVEEMKKRKEELGFTFAKISELSDVPMGTLQKIFNGETKNPRYDTIQAITKVLNMHPKVIKERVTYHSGAKQGEYTLDDYYALPDDDRVELIDGYIYDMGAPTSFHQLMAGELYRQISNYIIDHNGKCTPFISPIDVQLDNDEKTMVQPDVIIVCNPDQIVRRNIIGAPDFVIEVLSESTRKKDYTVKLRKYDLAGVKEYWMIDPKQEIVLVYYFEDEMCPMIYPLGQDIPVHIYGKKLVLKFDRIAKWAKEKL